GKQHVDNRPARGVPSCPVHRYPCSSPSASRTGGSPGKSAGLLRVRATARNSHHPVWEEEYFASRLTDGHRSGSAERTAHPLELHCQETLSPPLASDRNAAGCHPERYGHIS